MSEENRYGSEQWPYTGSLAAIDILNGGCADEECANVLVPDGGNNLNKRCEQSQTDSVFMFLTVAVLLATLVLAFMRMKRGI
jgi:hypothetical protein